MRNLETKYAKLIENLQKLDKVLVAFSGGVDSTLLLYAAKEALGKNVLAVTAFSPLIPERDVRESAEFCQQLGIGQIGFTFNPMSVPEFAENQPHRCYICKKNLFTSFLHLAKENGAVLCEGSNLDDLHDYRPGLKALAELKVHSPLREEQLTKAEIRCLSKKFALPTWDKPSFACLASRFAYGEKITIEKLKAVDRAEQLLFTLGFKQFRVRVHGELARIEVLPEHLALAATVPIRREIYCKFQEYGFRYVTLDLLGYRTGSMNEILKQ